MTTDRLTLARTIEEAGIAREGAERVASAIFDAIHDNVATKQDIEALRSEMNLRFEQVDRRIDQVVVRLSAAMVVMLGLLFTALHLWPPGHG